MGLRKLILAALACLVAVAVSANAAQAALHFNVNGSSMGSDTNGNISGGPFTLSGTTLGTTVTIDPEIIHCFNGNCVYHPNGTITGQFTVTKPIVTQPPNCTVGNPGQPVGTVNTNSLVGQVIMDPNNGSGPVFYKFAPATGTKIVELEFHGELCALDELALPLAGSFAGESANATGVEEAEQKLTFGSTQQTTSNSALTLGGGSVVLSGTAVATLASGLQFGPTE